MKSIGGVGFLPGKFCLPGCIREGEYSVIKKPKGFSCIGLHNPKSPLNIGSTLRAAGCYRVSMVAITGRGNNPFIKARTDTQKAYRHIPVVRCENLKDIVPYNCTPVAVDLIKVAKPLPNYQHHERAFYIFGAEDETLDESITSWCKDIIYIPTNYCMNLAATVNVVLYDRMVKMGH